MGRKLRVLVASLSLCFFARAQWALAAGPSDGSCPDAGGPADALGGLLSSLGDTFQTFSETRAGSDILSFAGGLVTGAALSILAGLAIGGVTVLAAAVGITAPAWLPAVLLVAGVALLAWGIYDTARHWDSYSENEKFAVAGNWLGGLVGSAAPGMLTRDLTLQIVSRRELLQEVADVNHVEGDLNCLSNAVAADHTLAGQPTWALPYKGRSAAFHLAPGKLRSGILDGQALEDLRVNYDCPECNFVSREEWVEPRSLVPWLKANGVRRGILVAGKVDDPTAHAMNVILRNGRYYLVDAQSRLAGPLEAGRIVGGSENVLQFFATDPLLR